MYVVNRHPRRRAFTLVELLVVIGIIALLIAILLPALSKARESSNTVKCAANLRSVGEGVALYAAEFRGALPASNLFAGMKLDRGQQYGPGGTQSAGDVWGRGYVHWSSQIFEQPYDTSDPVFAHLGGIWKIFTCPSLENGGVPPCNTFPGNQAPGCVNEAPGVLDAQAPRMAYMLNEALTPRGRLGLGVPGSAIKRPYHYVQAGSVRNAAGTVLGTENWGLQSLMMTKDQVSGAKTASNSRRPVSGVSVSLSNANGAGVAAASAENLYSASNPERFVAATANQVLPDPSADPSWTGGSIDTTLNFVGRNHGGAKRLGTVAGGAVSGWDLRLTNFLYVDGHVETKNLVDTIYPVSQWGEEFYSLTQ